MPPHLIWCFFLFLVKLFFSCYWMYYSYPVQYCCCLAMPLVLILVIFYQMFFLLFSYTRIILFFFLIHDMIHDTEGLFFLYAFVNNAVSAENHLWQRVMLGTLLNSVAVSCLASALVLILVNFYQMFFLPLSYTRIIFFFLSIYDIFMIQKAYNFCMFVWILLWVQKTIYDEE